MKLHEIVLNQTLSNGSENARYTLIHHPGLFRAAALFTCCDDPVALRSAFGPKMIREATQWGYPALDYTDRADARDYSLAANVRNIRTPLLLQISDREYLYSLETYAAYIEAKQCIDMYVFPDEYHIFWQPAHRLAVYKRTIAWFEFLLHERPVEPTLTTNSVDSEGARPAVCQKPS